MKHLLKFNEGKASTDMAKKRLMEIEADKATFKEIKKKLSAKEFKVIKDWLSVEDFKTLSAKPTKYSF